MRLLIRLLKRLFRCGLAREAEERMEIKEEMICVLKREDTGETTIIR